MLELRSAPQIKLPPANVCIYCGQTDVKLTDEHIIPEALLGHYLLPRSTCEVCQASTSSFEEEVLRNQFGVLRRQLGMRSRRMIKKKRVATARFEASISGVPVNLEPEQLPRVLQMPMWAAPGIVRGVETGGSFADVQFLFANTIGNSGNTGKVRVRTMGNLTNFARLIAKIAHGLAWEVFRDGVFEPIATDLIRGRNFDGGSMLVGASYHKITVDNAGPAGKDALHVCSAQDWDIGRFTYLVANVCLFLPYGGPTYAAVIGRKPRPGWAVQSLMIR